MKKVLFLIAIFGEITTNAQNYLITFAGTGESTSVTNVKVENLTENTSLTLNGSDILNLTGTVGIDKVENEQSLRIKIYPNPMTVSSVLQIYPPEAGMAMITIFDMTGKLIGQIQYYLDNSLQEFRLSGINSGIYLININGSTYHYSGKLMSNSKTGGTIKIEKITNNQIVSEKTSKEDFKGDQGTIEMAYTTGDRLKFTGISGNYSVVKSDIITFSKTITFNFISCTDGDNVNYPVVEIGTQVWMAENLKTTRYKDGITSIPLKTDSTEWSNLITPGYCWYYNNEAANKATYGALYNWHTVSTGNLCPAGWHIPTDDEWTTLITYLGDESDSKLKETGTAHWQSPNTGASDESGFTALPGGIRDWDGTFGEIGLQGYWWSATEYDAGTVFFRYLQYDMGDGAGGGYQSKMCGLSVRCLKDK